MHQYAKVFIAALALFFITLSSVNVVIDPFGLFGTPLIQGVSARKTQASTRGRMVKAYRSVASEPDILLVGNSRVELGLNTSHPGFQSKKVYNLGLPGADIMMQCAYAWNVIAQSDVTRVIIGIDFLDFLFKASKKTRRDPNEYKQRLKYWQSDGVNVDYIYTAIKEHASAVFSLDTLTASMLTVATQKSYLGAITESGQMTDNEFYKVVKEEGLGVLFTQKEQELSAKLNNSEWILLESGQSSSHYFEYFSAFVAELQNRGIKVDLFISPYHARYLEIVERSGYMDEFLQWKALLATHLQQQNFFAKGQLVDFSQPNPYTLEKVPDYSVKNTFMQWYWEPAHYRNTLGDEVLNQLLLKEANWGVPFEGR